MGVNDQRLRWQSWLVLAAVLPWCAIASLRYALATWDRAAQTALAISLGLALLVFLARAATPLAALTGGVITAALTLGFSPWYRSALPALLALFALTLTATRFGRAQKQQLGVAEDKRGRNAGQVQSIEISTVTISRTLPVGVCPVYGIASSDNNRVYILNRGSGTVTVINSPFNELDTTPNRQNFDSATGTLTLPPPTGVAATAFKAGPVFADYYAPASQLVTANYDSNTITIINVSLDQYGNDSALFGQAVTVPVGTGRLR